VVEGFGGLATYLTSVGFCSILRVVSFKVSFTGYHLVNTTHVQRFETYEWVRLERRGVSITSWIGGGGAPLLLLGGSLGVRYSDGSDLNRFILENSLRRGEQCRLDIMVYFGIDRRSIVTIR